MLSALLAKGAEVALAGRVVASAILNPTVDQPIR
jgi:hypothetical protein